MSAVRSYALVTGAYWAFTLTDGALRMLVLLHFHALGYGPLELAFLFVFYELFGVVTNLLGGFLAARMGLRVTLLAGLALQVVALGMLSLVAPTWAKAWSVAYVMAAQALSGIAKDLTKMSSKSAIKTLLPGGAESSLFRWVAVLTGSKNALKGAGFFLGGFLLTALGFQRSLWAMAAALLAILLGSTASLPRELGKAKTKSKLGALFAKEPAINRLSAARFFLFGARDIWFVVGVPVFLSATLGWSFTRVGTFLALWVIGYGAIQSLAPAILGRFTGGRAPQARAAQGLAFLLAASMALVPVGLSLGYPQEIVVLGGLGLFGVVFALNSSVHSYLVLAYSDGDRVALNVGFYYMANAGGRLVGTLLSGVLYQTSGLAGCLWASVAFAAVTAALSLLLPRPRADLLMAEVKSEGGSD
ncbi:MAG: organoarsenical effux MFS transporter ArsJ [Byssovorax sp.]